MPLRTAPNKMSSLTFLVYFALAVLSSNIAYGTVDQVPLPPVNLTEWWGPGNAPAKEDTRVHRFSIEFTKQMISDLIYRLKNPRPFVEPLEGVAFQYGFNSTTLKHWMKYLAEEYPFQQRQDYLNQYPHFKTCIQGLNIHFIKVTSKRTDLPVIPLLIVHGWPGSVREFYETIPFLIAYGEAKGLALHIILPSVPGFGYSDGAVRPGMGMDKVAVILRNLMHRLGYPKYYLQGGDLGGIITSNIATFFSDEVLGYHTNFVFIHTVNIMFRLMMGSLHPEEMADPVAVSRIYPFIPKILSIITATGYLHIQATKPDTVGVGLSDSPAGLMAYTLEKVSTAVRKKFILYPDGGLTEILTAEQIFDNYMIYWSSNCITTAIRIYADTFNKRYFGLRINEIRSPVPTWVLQAPDEILYLPPFIIKGKYPNLLHETLPSEGGHFYAWEKPELFAEDVVSSIVAFRDWHAMNSTMYTKCSGYISN